MAAQRVIMCADYIRCPFPGIRKVFRSAGILPAVAEASRLRTRERDARADSRRDGGATAIRYPPILGETMARRCAQRLYRNVSSSPFSCTTVET